MKNGLGVKVYQNLLNLGWERGEGREEGWRGEKGEGGRRVEGGREGYRCCCYLEGLLCL